MYLNHCHHLFFAPLSWIQMISSYESQLHAMKVDLREAYLSIEAEQLRRQQLEEDLRRLFLKNMTAMNFEALSLFQNSHTMVDAVPVPAAVAPVVELGSPPRPVRRDLNYSARQASGGGSGQKSASKRGKFHFNCLFFLSVFVPIAHRV